MSLSLMPRIDDGLDQPIEVSVVVPVYNEVENLTPLHEALTYAMRSLERSYEIILVDDGSTDGSRNLLRQLSLGDPHLRALQLRSNCGQSEAMAAGFDHARGSVVVTMDGDLQNDPADIPRLLEELDRGYDVVCGWRRNRKDAWLTRLLPSQFANMLIRWTTRVPIHDTGCSLKAYRAWVIRSLHLYSDMHRFIAALGVGVGARISELPVRHHPRCHGRSKYGLTRIFKVLADLLVIKMLVQFSAHPIRAFTLCSIPLALVSAVLFVHAFFKFERSGAVSLNDVIVTQFVAAAAVTLLVSINIFLLGFLAELQLRVSGFFQGRTSVTSLEAVH
ncbi:MAG: glycosyltransferase family 2 protein [Planctomycetota bacterium]|jgi:glycosyltransferase involved in cell wall biosynthesis